MQDQLEPTQDYSFLNFDYWLTYFEEEEVKLKEDPFYLKILDDQIKLQDVNRMSQIRDQLKSFQEKINPCILELTNLEEELSKVTEEDLRKASTLADFAKKLSLFSNKYSELAELIKEVALFLEQQPLTLDYGIFYDKETMSKDEKFKIKNYTFAHQGRGGNSYQNSDFETHCENLFARGFLALNSYIRILDKSFDLKNKPQEKSLLQFYKDYLMEFTNNTTLALSKTQEILEVEQAAVEVLRFLYMVNRPATLFLKNIDYIASSPFLKELHSNISASREDLNKTIEVERTRFHKSLDVFFDKYAHAQQLRAQARPQAAAKKLAPTKPHVELDEAISSMDIEDSKSELLSNGKADKENIGNVESSVLGKRFRLPEEPSSRKLQKAEQSIQYMLPMTFHHTKNIDSTVDFSATPSITV